MGETYIFLKGNPQRHYVKGYLRYKTVTSETVSFEAQVKNFFIL